MEIVYTFIGKLPSYTIGSLHQARLWSKNKITLLCDDTTSPYLNILKNLDINIESIDDYRDHDFLLSVEKNMNKFCITEKLEDRKLLFIRSFERFFILQNYMRKTNTTNILFLELDLLIYFNPETLLPIFSQREVCLTYVDKELICSAIFYVKSLPILENITQYFIDFIFKREKDKFMSEMIALSEWIQIPENKDRVWMLPSISKDERYNILTYKEFETFGKSVFDGMGIGIALTGPDYTHRDEWIQKNKKWWGSHVNYDEINYTWQDKNGLRVLYGKGKDDKEDYKVQCIHVHNKHIDFFLSKPMQFNFATDNNPFIHGDRFLKMAHVVLRKKERKDYYEVKDWTASNLFYFEDIPPYWVNPKMIFMNTEDVDEFMNHLSKLKKPFILITHNSDTNVTDKYLALCEHPRLIRWFTQNLCINHPLVSYLPIGFANPIWAHGNYELLASIQSNMSEKNILFYANFLVETNQSVREACLKSLQSKGIPIFPRSPPFQYLDELSKSIFCICPEGNGIDTHRFWEALYLYTLPIVLRNPLTERFEKEFPCILLDSWDTLDTNLITKKEVSDKIDWLFKNPGSFIHKIQFSYYYNQIISCFLNS